MNEVRHLHELEIVREGDGVLAYIFMLHAITTVLQGVESLVLNFPAHAPRPTGARDGVDSGA